MHYDSSEEEDDEHTYAIQKMRAEWTPDKIAIVDSLYEQCMYKSQMYLIASERYKQYDDWLSYPSVLINAIISTALFTNIASTFESGETSQVSVIVIYINIACAVLSTLAAVLAGILLRLEPGKTSQKCYVTSTMHEYLASTIKTESAYEPWVREDFEMFYSRIETSIQHVNSTAPSLPSDIRRKYTKVPDKPFEQIFKLNHKKKSHGTSSSYSSDPYFDKRNYNQKTNTNNNNNNPRNTGNKNNTFLSNGGFGPDEIIDNQSINTSSEDLFVPRTSLERRRRNTKQREYDRVDSINNIPDEEDEEMFKQNLFLETKQGIIDEQNKIIAERKRRKHKAKRERKKKNNNNMLNIISNNNDGRAAGRQAMQNMKLLKTQNINPKEIKSEEKELNGNKLQAGMTIGGHNIDNNYNNNTTTSTTIKTTNNDDHYDKDAIVIDME